MNISNALRINNKCFADSKEFKLAVEILLAYVLKKNREYIFAHKEEKISDKDYKLFGDLIKRLKEGEPVAYITGQKEFYGIPLYVDKRVLIPRPETEFLVDKTIQLINSDKRLIKKTVNICDVGTGSGNIAIALACACKNIKITAVDIDKGALEVARFNVKNHNLQKRIQIKKSDMLLNVKEEKFDLIIANLPYIGTETNNFISRETKKYEPKQALYGGDDGLSLYRRIFTQICNLGEYPYYVMGEIGFSHRDKIRDIVKKYLPEAEIEIFKDLAGLDRHFVVKI